MKAPHLARKWMALFGLLLFTALPTHAVREGAVANTSPKTGTPKIVVRNLAFTSLDVTVGDQVAYNFPHFTKRVFSSAKLYEPPYPIEITFRDPHPLGGKRLRFTNPNSVSSYETPTQTFRISIGTNITGVDENAILSYYAQYEWVMGYWEVTIQGSGSDY